MEKQFNRPHRFCPKLASTKILPITGNQVSDCLRLQLLSKFWLSIVNSACGFGYRQHLSRDNLAFQSFTKYVWPGTSKEKMLRQRWSLDSSRFCLLSGFVTPSGALIPIPTYYWSNHPPPHFFRPHRSSTLDFHFLSHCSYINHYRDRDSDLDLDTSRNIWTAPYYDVHLTLLDPA